MCSIKPSPPIYTFGNTITLTGDATDLALAERVISELMAVVASGQVLTRRPCDTAGMVEASENESPAEVLTLDILSRRGRPSGPRPSIRSATSTRSTPTPSCSGWGGTGKTYLAMAKAVRALQTKQVTRSSHPPAVEASERLGFLPGTLSEKIDPYLRPLHDALHDMMDPGGKFRS